MRALTQGRSGGHHGFQLPPFQEAFSLISSMLLAALVVLLLVSTARWRTREPGVVPGEALRWNQAQL